MSKIYGDNNCSLEEIVKTINKNIEELKRRFPMIWGGYVSVKETGLYSKQGEKTNAQL